MEMLMVILRTVVARASLAAVLCMPLLVLPADYARADGITDAFVIFWLIVSTVITLVMSTDKFERDYMLKVSEKTREAMDKRWPITLGLSVLSSWPMFIAMAWDGREGVALYLLVISSLYYGTLYSLRNKCVHSS